MATRLRRLAAGPDFLQRLDEDPRVAAPVVPFMDSSLTPEPFIPASLWILERTNTPRQICHISIQEDLPTLLATNDTSGWSRAGDNNGQASEHVIKELI